MADEIERRKGDHIRLAASAATDGTAPGTAPSAGSGAGSGAGSSFDDVRLVHVATPEVDFAELDPSATLLGRELRLPLVISAMTGGHADGARINATLGRAAERHGLAMGVGSQRAALRDPALRDTYTVARREAPGAFLMANVGAAQLVRQGDAPPLSPADVASLAEMIEADAIAVHLNAIQELIQPEGDRNARGWLPAIAELVAASRLPVIAKETGGGVSESVARRLAEAGVAAIDVGGLGGTSFATIEAMRAAEQGDERGPALAADLGDWGIPTAASVALAARAGRPVVATGGVRSGVDAARAIALGADAVGVARPLLLVALEGDEAVDSWIGRFRESLLAAMFLTGSARLADLRRVERIVTGPTATWLTAARAAD